MADKQSFQDQLREVIENSTDTRYQICKATGIDQANLARFMGGGGMSIDTIDKLFKHLNLKLISARPSSRTVARKAR